MSTSVEQHIEVVQVEPVYEIRAVQVPRGWDLQDRVRELLESLGIVVHLYDGVVEQDLDPAEHEGRTWQWGSFSIEGVKDWAQVGDWIVVHGGHRGHIYVETMTSERFELFYKAVKS